MIEQKQRSILKLAAMIFIIAAGVYALVSVYNTKKNPHDRKRLLAVKTKNQLRSGGEATGTKDIVRLRRTWGPIMTSWYGEDAPDFTLTDINGKEHKLSDYRGRNVILTFWATWCMPCIAEIPSLITLRNMISEDKLMILAISSEPWNG